MTDQLPQDQPGSWAARIIAANDAELARIEAEQARAARLASAVNDPYGPAWAEQREETGIAGAGLDASERHASLKRGLS